MAPMAVMATHGTTLAASGSLGRNERRGGDGGDGGESDIVLRIMGLSPGFDRMCFHIPPSPSGERSIGFDSERICEPQIDHFVMAITSAKATV